MYPSTFEARYLLRYLYTLNESITANEIQEAFVSLNVYYHSIHYTISEENIQITDVDVMANFGGIKLFVYT